MKRRITVEQLRKLTEEQQKKLKEWWSKGNWEWDTQKYFSTSAGLVLPLLDIGQMIELLHDDDVNVLGYIGYANFFKSGAKKHWVCLGEKGNDLVDALWEAVKAVL